MTKLYDDSSATSTGSLGVYDFLGVGPGPDYQSFSTGSSAVTLTSLDFDLSDADPQDGQSLTVDLFSNSGTAAGTQVASLGTIADSRLSATASLVTLTVSSTFTLVANTTYWIGLSNDMLGGGANWYYTSAADADATGTGTSGQAEDHNGTVDSTKQFIMTVNATSLCFVAGALVLTSKGEVPIETVQEGDLVVCVPGGHLRPVRWIGTREVDLRSHPDPDAINPVRVCADAFGRRQPHRDLILSPNHALYVDRHLVAAHYLINGATIRQEQWDKVAYYHLELDSHDIMLVNGMPAESFLDIGNRSAFRNGGEPVMLHPDFVRRIWDAEVCAPDLPKGEDLTRLRQRLLDRAEQLGHALTQVTDLSVVANNRRIRPVALADGFQFILPKGTRSLQLESRSSRPSEIRADRVDARLLGVGVLGLALDDTPISLDSSRLTAGWHEPEPGLRWTNGAATLRTDGARTLTLRLFSGHAYWLTNEAPQDNSVAA